MGRRPPGLRGAGREGRRRGGETRRWGGPEMADSEKRWNRPPPPRHYGSGPHEESGPMAGGSAGVDLGHQLDILERVGAVGDLSDGQLLERFLVARDEPARAAFAALVDRHGAMV